MAQFDVFRLADGMLVVDCQADLLDEYETRFVAPLIELGPGAITMSRLHPRFEISGEPVVMLTHFATTIKTRELKSRMTSLAHERLRIIGAIDVLTGSG